MQNGNCTPHAAPIRFLRIRVQPYSSWSCSPAELHYASGCDAKVHIWLELDKYEEEKSTLQFEL